MAYINASKNAGLKKNRVTRRKKETGYINASERNEKNQGGLLGGLGYVGKSLGLGAMSVAEGVGDILSAGADLLVGDTEMAKYRFKENVTADAAKKVNEKYNPGTIMRGVGDVASGIGNSLVFMIPGAGPYLAATGYTGMGISSAAEKTGDVGLKELGYGAASGALEFGLEALTGGIGKAGKNLGAAVVRKFGKDAAEATGKATARNASKLAGRITGKGLVGSVIKEIGLGALGEGAEEMLSTAIDPRLQKLFGIDPNAKTSKEEIAYAGIIGAFSGGLMTAGPAAINYKTSASVGKDIRERGQTKDFLDYTRRVLDASTRTQERYADKAEASKTPADAGKLKKTVDFLNLGSATRKSKRAGKRVEDMAETVRKNLTTYERYLQKADKSPKELEISDAVLGELRGNVFLLENAAAIEIYEDAVLELEDDDKQELVDEVNEDAKRLGLKRSDYTVADLNDNVDDILTTVAIKYMMPEKYGVNLFEERQAKKKPAEPAQEAAEPAQGAETVQAEQQPAEGAKPVQGRYKGAGAVRIAGGKQVKELGLSDEQYRAYKAAEIMAPALGTEIEINESLERDGKAVNGYYDPKTNTLKININAVRGDKKIALYTLGHESTHYVKANATEQFGRLADFVETQLGERWSTLTAEKRESLSNLNLLTGMTEEQIADLVREEVVADGMELILTDGKVLEELAQKDRSLWQTVKNWIQKTIAKIKEYYGQLNQASKTAQTLKETLDTLEEVERLFTEGVKEAGEQARTVRGETTEDSENPDIRYSIDETTTDSEDDTNDGRKDAESPDVYRKRVEELEEESRKQTEEIRKLQFERFRRAVKDGQIESNTQRKALSKGADAVLDSIGVTDGRNRRELLRRMTELYAAMSAEEGITYEQAFDEAGEIADWLISRQPDVINAEMAEQADEIIHAIHGAKVRLTGTQALEAATVYGSVNEYRKAMFGRISVTQDKKGTPLDVQWSEWADQYPEIFDPNTKEADMPLRLAEAYENLVAMRDNVESVETYINPDTLTATIFTQIGEIGYTSEAGVFNDRTVLADMLLEVVENEQDYKIAKQYKAKAGELAEAERRQADLGRQITEVNREIKDLQGRITNVKKNKRQPWVMDALQDALKRKGELMSDLNTVIKAIQKEDERLLSIRNAAPFRRAVVEANKRANAAEKKAERADERVEKYEQKREEQKKQSEERLEITLRVRSVRQILGQLNTMLYHPNRQKHVPEALRGLTEAVLKLADPKEFQKNRGNIRTMAELASKIARLDSKVAKTAAEQETLDKMKSKYEHLEAETISTYKQAKALLTAFEQYQKDTLGEAGFDKETIDNMADLVEQIKEVPMTEMTLESLKAVETFYTMILHQVNSANQTFATEKALNIDELGQKASQEARDAKALKVLSPKGREWVGMASVRKFFLQNMKPLTVFEAIGSNQFKELFQRVLDGEETWATDILDARKKILDARKRYKYKDWELAERKPVKTKDGTVNLSLAERMALYAYSFRDQAKSHLEGGGFVLDPSATEQVKVGSLTPEILEKRLNNQKRYTMDEFMMGELAETLTDEQKAYVKEMQQYLTDMGKKGNEVSQKLYGMDIFTEEHYFPIKVKSEYLASQTGKTGDPNIKNRGMTKEVVPEAKDPLVLQGFDEVMVDHINSMATYHSFVLPIEDLTRVLNYKPVNYLRDEQGNVVLDKNGKPKVDENASQQYDTLKSVISSKYGDEVNRYIVQLIRDLNGGARRDAAAGIIDKGITQFKRASTMASLSVLIQQPTSIVRAAAYIEPKYLFNTAGVNLKNHKELWERVKKYAPVAIIKEMGGYDTGVGARTADYLNAATYEKGERLKGFLTDADYRAEVFGFGAAYADELAWIQMFEACVNEQADKLRKSRDSEEVLKAAGERFTEIVRHTQVYDSTLTRSENMRSKDTGMKMATAFMAEPTTVVSMVAEAIIKGERGDKKFRRNTAGAVIGSILLNSLLSSLVYAMRDDDEDKTYEEKYISTLAMEMAEGVNPAEYFPVFRDIMSLVKGYEVERSDMALIGDLINSIRRMSSSTLSVSQKLTNTGGAVAAFFGLPVTNIMRDVNGLRYTFLHQTDTERFTEKGLSVALKEQFDTMWGLFDEETTNGYQLYQSALDHDAEHFARVAARYESTEAVEQALRKALRDYDPRINEAAEARLNGELEVYEDLLSRIEKEGNFDRNMLIRAVNNQMIYIKDHMEDETVPKADEEEEEAPEALYKTSDLNDALERGDGKDYADIYNYLMEIKQEDGKTEAQARSSVKSSITSYWRKRYLEAWESNDTSEIKRIQAILVGTKLYGDRNEVAKMGEGWVKAYAESLIKK